MAARKLLMPYNFAHQDRKALEFVVRHFADGETVSITLLHLYTPAPEVETSDKSVMRRLRENLNYLNAKIAEQGDALEQVKMDLVERGIPAERIQTIFRPRKKDIATEILDLLRTNHHDIIVLNHKTGRVVGFFTGSVYSKVVQAAQNSTVCIVT